MSALARAAALARPRAGLLVRSILLGAGAVVAATALLALSGYLISRAAERPAMLTLLVVIVGVRVLGMARAGLRYHERLASHDLAFGVLAALRVRFWDRLAWTLPTGSAGRARGDLLSRFVADVEALQHLYLRALGPPLVAVVVAVAAVGVTWVLLPAAGLVLAGALVTAVVTVPLLAGTLAAVAGRRQAPARAALTSDLLELVEGSAELAACGREEDWAAQARDADARLAAVQRRDAIGAGLTEGFGALVAGLAVTAVAAVGAGGVAEGEMDGVLLAALVLLALGAFEAVAPLRDAARHLHGCATAATRVEEVTAAAPAVTDPATPLPVPAAGSLALHDVSVRYSPEAPTVLDGVSLTLAPGRATALVGPSGAGKSTLAALLVRFRDPDHGRVTVGGTDLRDLRVEAVRDTVRLAGQDAHLFTASIAQNVRVGKPDACAAEVEQALAEAGLGDWVASLPQGIETLVGRDGARVSGGQRQRIALARGLISGARFIVCDEPAAHLDPEAGRELLRHLATLGRDGRGVLVVSHVTDGLEGFDEVRALHGGRLAAVGASVA